MSERLDFITLAKHIGYRAGCCLVVRQGHEARAKQPRAAFDVVADEGITHKSREICSSAVLTHSMETTAERVLNRIAWI